MIGLVGSEVVAQRHTDIDLETAPDNSPAYEESTPRTQTEDFDVDPYQTPVALRPADRKNKARVTAELEDTDDERSEDLEERKKQRAPTRVI